MLEFNGVRNKFEDAETPLLFRFSIMTYYRLPARLLSQCIQYTPPTQEKSGCVIIEAVDSDFQVYAIGIIEEKAILSLIFGDDPNFNGFLHANLNNLMIRISI